MMRWAHGIWSLLGFALAGCLVAPVPVPVSFEGVDSSNASVSPLESPEERVVVLSTAMTDDERGVADCVRKAMREQNASLRMVSAREFRDALFPWFDFQTSAEELRAGLSHPAVRDAIARLNVRYAILVNEEKRNPKQGLSGFVTVSVQVWDVEQAQDRGVLWARASGGSEFLGIPYPLMIGVVVMSFPEEAVCRGLSEWLGRALMSGEH